MTPKITAKELSYLVEHEQQTQQRQTHQIKVCIAAGCLTAHSQEVKKQLEAETEKRGLAEVCPVKGVGCLGLCAAAPLVSVEPEGRLYQSVTVNDAAEIVSQLDKHPARPPAEAEQLPFYRRQMRIVTENSGKIDPMRIEDYIAAGGYSALAQALATLLPAQVVEEVTRSGLRGRGGAGYPTG